MVGRLRMKRFLERAMVAAFACLAAVQFPALAKASESDAEPVEAGPSIEAFRTPPQSARPRVWWHWLNGNIAKDGIAKDLAWMKRSGIGGVQTFDINFQTPDVLDKRLNYMTVEWNDALRFAAQETDRLGLELTVASSAGWSLTGGPWVKPEDAIKKLVWSETIVSGGKPAPIMLAAPPTISGPFQDIPLASEPGANPGHVTPTYYADIAVLAYRSDKAAALPVPVYSAGDGTILDAAILTDGAFTGGLSIRRDSQKGASIAITYGTPQTVRLLSAYLPGAADIFGGPAVEGSLEASQDGKVWRQIAQYRPTVVPGTVGFAPVEARYFRLRLSALDNVPEVDTISAPGYAGFNYTEYLRSQPFRLAELQLLAEPRIDQFETKAGFSLSPDYHALSADSGADETGIAPADVLDLTSRLRPDGSLDWKPRAGTWRIIRLGATLTGKTNHPAPAEATGLEVDKLDGEAVRRYMETYLQRYREAVGPELMGERGINAILTDSTEVGAFNWTPGLLEAFRQQRGYDPRPWLPALTGVIIGSRKESDRFLFDYRKTISDLHASAHYAAVAEVAHEAGLKVYGEALEGWRVSLGDDIDMRRYTDIPMAALWTFPSQIGPRPLLVADMRTAASSAHLRGKRIVAAESMTSSRFPWAHGPAELRKIVDTEFAHGINRIIVHTSPHQPVDDKQPGLSLRHIGQFFTRHETWANMARPWIDYIARSSYLLQQGRFVGDVAYFVGEDAPAGTLATEGRLADVPRRYGYDFVNAAAILDDFEVEGGDLVTAGGARYRVLYLGGASAQMTLPVLRRIAQLAKQGATIVGKAPTSSPSLADDQKSFRKLVRKLWRAAPVTRIGRGRVIAGNDVESALASIGVPPDFTVKDDIDGVDFVHRELADGDIYFVRNSLAVPAAFEARFRVKGKAPEIWDAVTGKVSPTTYRTKEGQTIVPLKLLGETSRFVIFRNAATLPALIVPEPALSPVAMLDGPWTVAFQADRGAPARIDLSELSPLDEHSRPGVRYFSGVAGYRTTFETPDRWCTGSPLAIDLGRVGDLAEVTINDQLAGTAWQAPYILDIADLVKPGTNSVEIKVANLWVNRLIGDAQDGAEKMGWTTSPMYKPDAPLRPSGLIGPVRLLASNPGDKADTKAGK